MNVMDLMKERHSVRQYKKQPIEKEKKDILNALVKESNTEAGLNIQIIYDEPTCFEGGLAHYGKFSGVANYIALVGLKGDNLEETTGYYGEKIVLKAQELGLNTCWVALTHGKSQAVIGKGEKQTCLIALGYGKTQGIQSKSKKATEVSNIDKDAPAWFKEGIEAALLAPTAVNQQRFYFTRNGDNVTAKVKGIGALTKLDLGIVKYHFEAVSGHKIIK